jgi:hypothetical protein
MKRVNTMMLIILLVITAGCGGGNKQSADALITVDVTKRYPKKELILQDIFDVEYIALETTDEFLTQGWVKAIGKDIILVRNRNRDGDIFVFDRNGKAIRKINRQGQIAEEYTVIQRIVLDEDQGEIFVNDQSSGKIVVYDFAGNFKRRLQQNDNVNFFHVYSFDSENLICNHPYVRNKPPFAIISKQDGSATNEIQIPFEEKKSIMVTSRDEANNVTYGINIPTYYPIVPHFDNWVLVEPSSDTIYSYSSNHTMQPFIIRTPSVQSMDPEVFLFLSILTDRYYFMETRKKEYDFGTDIGFPSTGLIYDKQAKAIFEYTVHNDDYVAKTSVNLNSTPVNDEIATWQLLEAHRLVEAYEKGQLKGKLKEIAATLDEGDNPVIMIVKHRK